MNSTPTRPIDNHTNKAPQCNPKTAQLPPNSITPQPCPKSPNAIPNSPTEPLTKKVSSPNLTKRRTARAPIRNIKSKPSPLDFATSTLALQSPSTKDLVKERQVLAVAGNLEITSKAEGALASPLPETAPELDAEILGVTRSKTFDELPKSEREILYALNRENEVHERHQDKLRRNASENSSISSAGSTMNGSGSHNTHSSSTYTNSIGGNGPNQNPATTAGSLLANLFWKTASNDSSTHDMYSPILTTDITSVTADNRHTSTSSESAPGGSYAHPQGSEAEQWSIWSKVLNDFENFSKRCPKQLHTMVYNGIPHHFRAMAWQTLSGAHTSMYRAEYSKLLKLQSPNEKLINRDITRTYPEVAEFQKDGTGRDCLFNVMKAYSLVDREVGYCQGLCFIVGLLLMHVPEEDAFAIFCELMLNYRFGLRDLYKPGMTKLGLNIYQLQGLLHDHAPDLETHFIAQGMEMSSFASSWFLTIFTTTFTIKTASRILDCLLLDGPDIIFRIGIAVLLSEKDRLLKLDMEGILRYLNKEAPELYDRDPDLLIQKACQPFIKINERRMKRLEKDYNEKKAKEAEEQVEVRRLRDENSMLKERIEALESENQSLVAQLAKARVSHALEQEEKMIMKRELGIVKKHAKKLSSGSMKGMGINDGTDSPCEQINTHATTNVQNPLYSDEFVLQLQQELVAARLREAESDNHLSDLSKRLHSAEAKNERLASDKELLKSQEELVNVKYRYAECQSAFRDLQSRLDQLEQAWTNHTLKRTGNGHHVDTGGSSRETRENMLEKELMTLRIKEAQLSSENRENSLKLIEMEQWCKSLHKQISRSEDERAELKYKLQSIEQDQMKEESLGEVLRQTARKSSTNSANVEQSDPSRQSSREETSSHRINSSLLEDLEPPLKEKVSPAVEQRATDNISVESVERTTTV